MYFCVSFVLPMVESNQELVGYADTSAGSSPYPLSHSATYIPFPFRIKGRLRTVAREPNLVENLPWFWMQNLNMMEEEYAPRTSFNRRAESDAYIRHLLHDRVE